MAQGPTTTELPLVLYVEDDPDTFRLAQLRLSAKYRLVNAATDRDACAFLEKNQELHAILMDVELQGSLLDGLGLVKALRGLTPAKNLPDYAQRVPQLPFVPIMVLTAYTTRYTEAEVKALGATHFLTKPIDFMRLNLALAQANIQSVMARLASQTARPR